MVVGVAVFARLPHDFFAEDGFSINHRGDFSIRSAEVESDPAAVEVTAERFCGFFFCRNLCGCAGDDGEGALVDVLSHELVVECAGACGGVTLCEVFGDAFGPADIYAPAAALPEQEFQEAFGVFEIGAGA